MIYIILLLCLFKLLCDVRVNLQNGRLWEIGRIGFKSGREGVVYGEEGEGLIACI